MIFLGAAALIVIGGYELIIRIDAMIRPIKMFVNMWIGEHITFSRAMSYVDWGMFERPAYLLLCVAIGITAIAGRKKKSVWVVVAILSLLAFLLSREVPTLLFPGLFNTLVNSCLIVLFAGSLISFIASLYLSKKVKAKSIQGGGHSINYDPFNIHNRNN